jgi:Protein of unknown function (DUF3574)
MKFRSLLALAACALLAACQSAPKPGAVASGKAAPVIAAVAPEKWVRTELYFGIAPAEAEGLGLSAAEGTWRAFLDEEVTPRFPDGLTVLDGYGQWREEGQSEIERDRSRVLVIVHPDTPAKRAGIDALRAAYRSRTGAKSVLAVEVPVAAPRF